MRFLLLVITLFTLIHCGTKPDYVQEIFHDPVPPPLQADDIDTFPKNYLFDAKFRERIADAHTLDDVFVFDSLIALETNDDSIFGEVTDVLVIDDSWWIADRLTRAIYRFDKHGVFQQKIGEQGRGPGQFETIRRMFRAFDDHVAVTDPIRGQVLLFDKTGEFLTATPIMYGGKAIRPTHVVHWPQKEQLFITGFFTANAQTPVHIVVDPLHAEIRYGFGERHSHIHAAIMNGMGVRAHTAYAVIDDRIWSGSPYTTTLEIFDLEGNKLAILGEDAPRLPDQFIQVEDWAEIHTKADPDTYLRRHLLEKKANTKILSLRNLVLVLLGDSVDIYDRHGNLLRANLPMGSYLSRTFASGDQLIKVWNPGGDMTKLNDSARGAVEAMGEVQDQNPTILLYRLKPLETQSDPVAGE